MDNEVLADVARGLQDFDTSEKMPAGMRGKLFAAVDQLRGARSPAQHVALAEGLSLALHQWEWALRACDTAKQGRAREQIAALTADWREMVMP